VARTALRYLKSSPLAVVGLVALTLGVAGIALAAIPSSSDQTIHGCYKTKDGDLRVIDTEASPPQSCKRDEQPISWNQQGPPGAPGEPGTSIIASLNQTANFSSGPGAENATTMPLTGGADLSIDANEYWFVYPSPPGVDPPESCDAADSMPRELHLDMVATNVSGLPSGSEVTLQSWVSQYNDANTGPQVFPGGLNDFRFKNPIASTTTDVEIRAWDTCAGGDQRWGIGGLQFGISFKADIATLK